MNETQEVIRQQMEETKSQLSEKLESLESQVSNSIQSTGSAVTATAEAVQVTVETVTEALHEAAESVSHAFDLRRQFDRHPILVLGGAAVLGYLAVEFLTTRKKTPANRLALPQPVAVTLEPALQTSQSAAGSQADPYGSTWNQLKLASMTAMISVVQDLATRAVPSLIDYLAGDRTDLRPAVSQPSAMPESERSAKPFDATERLQVATTDSFRNGHSF